MVVIIITAAKEEVRRSSIKSEKAVDIDNHPIQLFRFKDVLKYTLLLHIFYMYDYSPCLSIAL